MGHSEDIQNRINQFITEETKDLDNFTFREVMEGVVSSIEDQLQALTDDEVADALGSNEED